jgi:hypothetical protein
VQEDRRNLRQDLRARGMDRRDLRHDQTHF